MEEMMSLPEENLEQWKIKLQAWKRSKQNSREWCRSKKLNYHAFTYWKKKIKKLSLIPETSPSVKQSPFIELKEMEPKTSSLEIEYQGATIHLKKNFDPSILESCLQTLAKL